MAHRQGGEAMVGLNIGFDQSPVPYRYAHRTTKRSLTGLGTAEGPTVPIYIGQRGGTQAQCGVCICFVCDDPLGFRQSRIMRGAPAVSEQQRSAMMFSRQCS